MTKKDYELIASVIKEISQRSIELRTTAFIAGRFVKALALENPHFDEYKFKHACGQQGY